MSQDTTVTSFTTLLSTSTPTLIGTIGVYSKTLVDLLFDIDGLDADHKAQIRLLDRSAILLLRGRLERLNQTLALALKTPDI